MPSSEKAELKQLVYASIGNDVDDLREASLAEVSKHRGAEEGLRICAKKVAELLKSIDSDAEEQSLSPEIVAILKRYVMRAVAIAESGATSSLAKALVAEGQARAFQHTAQYLKKLHDEEDRKTAGEPNKEARRAQRRAERARRKAEKQQSSKEASDSGEKKVEVDA